jgi:hypothetical protein
MNADAWLKAFKESVIALNDESNVSSDAEWAKFMRKVILLTGEKTDCFAVMKRDNRAEANYSYQYLNLDVVYIDNSAYNNWNDDSWDPPVLPSAVLEMVNSTYNTGEILHSLWKLLCIRTSLRVLIFYQSNSRNLRNVMSILENTVQRYGLMNNDGGELLAVMGDDSCGNDAEWSEYLTILKWQQDRFEKI